MKTFGYFDAQSGFSFFCEVMYNPAHALFSKVTMVGLVERKLSKSAIWCRRLAVFAIPYFLGTIIMYRLDKMTYDQTIGLLGFGFIILIVSILFAVRAMVQLWNEGAKGGKKTIFGLSLSVMMLAPFLIIAVQAMRYPPINDVSTNIFSPPVFSAKTLGIRRARGVSLLNDVETEIDEDEMASMLLAYPKIGPRRYPAGPERVYKAVSEIVKDRGWSITDIRGLPGGVEETKVKAESTKKNAKKSKKAAAKNSGMEAATDNDIFLDAVSSTLFMAFKNDVVIKIVSEEENTLVEMRSAGRWGRHDFGENARIIEKFMRDLDQNLIGIAGEG